MNSSNFFCELSDPSYLLFSESVPSFVYFSHIPVFILTALVGLFIIFKSDRTTERVILLWTIVPFLLWVFFDSIFWASNRPDIIMFVWSSIILIEPLIHLGVYLLHYHLLKQKFPNPLILISIFALFIPLLIFATTKLTLQSFNLNECLAVEGIMGLYYSYFLEGFFILMILYNTLRSYTSLSLNKKFGKIYLSLGILFFTISFTTGNLIGSFTSNWQIGQLGLLGMPVFLGVLAYSIVKFQTLQIKLLASQALVVTLWFLLFSALFISNIKDAQVIIGGTLVLFTFLGVSLFKSIKNEVQQREVIEGLATTLEKANTRLTQVDKLKSEFVSIASHQLRSPLTSISGYASLLREGAYGTVTKKMIEPIDRIERSARLMAESIEDYLNVSRIESGNMKYYLSDFNLVEEVSHLADDLRPTALKNGLILIFRTKIESNSIVNADIGKVGQIIHNLLNNAIKYTKKGNISVFVRDDIRKKRIYVDITDTGVGMNKETLNSIFQKFERGDKANAVNVSGTGLGLFVALKMAEAMGGTIIAESEGEGKGSRFTLELALAM